MGRVGQQAVALPQGFAHQAELAVLQIPEPAVDHARGIGGRAGGEIGLVQQEAVDAVQGQLAKKSDAVDAAAENDDGERSPRRDGLELRLPSIHARASRRACPPRPGAAAPHS